MAFTRVVGIIIVNKADNNGPQAAISRSGQKCDAQDCSAWSGNLTIPVLFVNDPRFSFG